MKTLINYCKRFLKNKGKVEMVDMPRTSAESVCRAEATSEQFDASKYEKLVEQIATLVKRYDAMADNLSDENMKDLLADVSSHIINTLILSGCEPIADEKFYDTSKHVPTPFAMVRDGTPIQSFVRIGVTIGKKVIIPAIVKI